MTKLNNQATSSHLYYTFLTNHHLVDPSVCLSLQLFIPLTSTCPPPLYIAPLLAYCFVSYLPLLTFSICGRLYNF